MAQAAKTDIVVARYASHEMADVWFAKDTTAAGSTGIKTPPPALNELLAAPQADLLGSSASQASNHANTQPVAAVGTAAAAVVHHGHIPSLRGLLDDERQVPLI